MRTFTTLLTGTVLATLLAVAGCGVIDDGTDGGDGGPDAGEVMIGTCSALPGTARGTGWLRLVAPKIP